MATINNVGVSLSGQTGTGSFVGSTSPNFVTPNIDSATATTITFSPTTGGITGTTTNNSAAAGIVGQTVTSAVSATGVVMTSTIPINMTTISLTAGDWDVYGNCTFSSTTISSTACWISLSAATQPDPSLYNMIASATALLTNVGMTTPYLRVSIASTTTVHISGVATFATGTCSISGTITARRAR